MKFGTFTLPAVQRVRHDQPRVQVELPLADADFAYRDDVGGRGSRFSVSGLFYPSNPSSEDQLQALADGVARILDLEENYMVFLEEALRYQTGPIWTDDTAESQSPGGTPFTLLGASTDYFYFGHREKWNKIQFDLETLGAYGARTWEYSKGDGTWGTLTIDTDGTSGFSQDGAALFTPPSDWKRDTVNSIANKFWVRVKVASVTTAATVNQIQINTVYLCILMDPSLNKLIAGLNEVPYSLTFVQKEDIA